MAGELNLAAAAREARRRAMGDIPGAFFGPVLGQLDRLTTAKMLREKIKQETNLRDAAIAVKTQEAADATISYQAGMKGLPPEAVVQKLGGRPERFNSQEYQRGVNEAQQVAAQNAENAAYQTVAALPSIEAVQGFKPANPAEAKARGLRLSELVDMGELDRKRKKEEEQANISKSITAAMSLEELDRIDPGADATLGNLINRRRKVLVDDQDRRLGESLSGYKGDLDGLDTHFKEKGIKPTPAELARAQDIVLKRKTYERLEADIEKAQAAEKKEDKAAAAALYAKAQNGLNAQIDDIEKKALKVNMVTGERTFDISKLSYAEQTELTRLKGMRLKAVDALSGLASGDPGALLGSMTPEQKRALAERLLKEMEAK